METQPIPTFINSTPAAFNAGEPSQQQKSRRTRAEKRQHAREKATKVSKPVKAGGRHGKKTPHVIAQEILASISPDQVDAVILQLLQNKERKAGRTKGTLESRITKDVPKKEKKELSPAKLEKIQKRREIRAEKKRLWLEKKATQGAIDGATAVSEPATLRAPADPVSLQDDEINFDEL
jgi:hypothetical protein